jgi:DNA invertase Pin-like site-specific DNA recombinase
MEIAFGYLRVSSVGQGDGTGLDRQREAIQRYADANGLTVMRFYEDQISGTTEERPSLGQLLLDLEGNGAGTVIVEKLDRLARDLLVSELIIRDFRQLGVRLVSTQEGEELDSNDPSRKLMRQIIGAIAEYDKQMVVLRLKSARDRLSQREGKRIEGRRKVYPPVLREYIWSQRLKGETYSAISGTINGWGLRNTQGGTFSPQLVRTIISC